MDDLSDPQFYRPLVFSLSTIDVLMFDSRSDVQALLKRFTSSREPSRPRRKCLHSRSTEISNLSLKGSFTWQSKAAAHAGT